MTRNAAIRLVAFTRHTVAPSIPDAPHGTEERSTSAPAQNTAAARPELPAGIAALPSGILTPAYLILISVLTMLPPLVSNSSAQEKLAIGTVSHSVSGPYGSGSINTSYEDRNDTIYYYYGPPLPFPSGYIYSQMGDYKAVREPASTSPGSGHFSPVTFYLTQGARLTVPTGQDWTSTASVSGFDGWEWTITDKKGEVPAGIYEGPTSFSYGSPASISYRTKRHTSYSSRSPFT